MPDLTATATALLLTLGALLAAFGVLGFLAVWPAADHDSLRFVQALAATGRRSTYTGLTLYVLHYSASGPALALLLAAAGLALATYLTKTSNTIVPAGAPS